MVADILKFIVCAKIDFIKKKMDDNTYSDKLQEFGYILCVVFLLLDLLLVFTTYKIRCMYFLQKL
jgi:hypothetical protein